MYPLLGLTAKKYTMYLNSIRGLLVKVIAFVFVIFLKLQLQRQNCDIIREH